MDKDDLHNLFTSNEVYFNLFLSVIKHYFHYWANEDPPTNCTRNHFITLPILNVAVRCHLSGLLAPIFLRMLIKLHHP